MTGVEILTSAQVVTETVSNIGLSAIVGCGILIICIIIGISIAIWDGEVGIFIAFLALGLIVGLIEFTGIMGITEKPMAYETQYKVTISDEVSLNDFYEHYEVIDQDGKIFTVREKTNER